jgi:hypothetical protein
VQLNILLPTLALLLPARSRDIQILAEEIEIGTTVDTETKIETATK